MITNKLSLILMLALLEVSTFSQNYCAGIRGNGELAPTHWSSFARIVESRGLPKSVAGGSSAVITMFFLDGISRNTQYSSDKQVQKYEQSLMLKSLVPHVRYLYEVDTKAPESMKLVSNVMGFTKDGFFGALKNALSIAKTLPTFIKALGEYGPLLNPALAHGLRTNFSFYKAQLEEGLKVFGSFDAKGDKNLFYREGIVDFKYLAVLLGRIADFYAGHGTGQVNGKMKKFMNECATISAGKDWSETIEAKPICVNLFRDSLDAYYGHAKIDNNIRGAQRRRLQRIANKKRTFPNKMVFSKIGSGLNAFPTTTLVFGDAEKKYLKLNKEYIEKKAQGIQDFSLNFNQDLKYGYWGRNNDLLNIKKNLKALYPSDTKSSKFEAIEGGVWFEALASSPAEPGLSKLVRVPDGRTLDAKKVINKKYFKKWSFYTALKWFSEESPEEGVSTFRKGVLSAGGWSDLHPTLVLKANGCDDVIYITRQGGESVFGQQIFIRISGYTDKISFWKDIADHNREGFTNLTEEEENSPWNKLYNLGNPNSSYSQSIKVADAVYCTNWDAYNVLKPGQLEPALKDSWNAPVFVKDASRRSLYSFGHETGSKSSDNFPGCIPKQ